MYASPSAMTQVELYFSAWNARDADGIVATFADGGTYTDPAVTGPPLSGPAIAEHVSALFTAFPDLSLELLNTQLLSGDSSDCTMVVRWLMRGTNTGPLLNWSASGRSVELRGADFISVASGKIISVDSYFDRQTMAEQLGFQVIVQPDEEGPWQLGYAYRTTAGNRKAAGAIALTWIDVRSDDEARKVEALGDEVAAELMKVPGFISLVGAGIGSRLFTITAWESADSIRETMRNIPHASAMKHFFTQDFAAAVGTGVWNAHSLNPVWVRCTACAKLSDQAEAGGTCSCGQSFPEPPQYL
jgi:steroid delta-isomerase-like uncharacterized protein